MLMTMESAMAIGFRSPLSRSSSSRKFSSGHDGPLAVEAHCRRGACWHWHDSHYRFLGRFTSPDHLWKGLNHRNNNLNGTNCCCPVTRLRSLPEHSGPQSDPLEGNWKQTYDQFEEIGASVTPQEDREVVRLTDAEIARTLIEVNSKAALMFSGLTDDEIQQNIIWLDISYLTDEHGDIYFEVNSTEDTLQTLIADDKLVQVIIGLDNIEMLTDMEVSGPSEFDLGIEEITSEVSDMDDDYEEGVVTIFEDEEDDMLSSETSSDWANLETMQFSHPMYFANKIAEVVANTNLDWMDQPSASIVVQGVLRPAFVEESSFVKKHPSFDNTNNNEVHHLGNIIEDNIEELDKDQSLHGGTAFYKLEMIGIQLVSAYGNQATINVPDFWRARPDIICHSAANIISRLKAGGEKTIRALKSLCWRHKGLQVEEVALSWVDSLGFDLRVCSGTQVQTLRFAFNSKATSEFSAEKQIHDLLFPRFYHQQQNWQQAHP